MYLNLRIRNAAAMLLRREAARAAAAPEEDEVGVHWRKRVAEGVGQLLLLKRRRRRRLRVEGDFLIVHGFPGRVGEHAPGVDDEAEGLVGEGEFVLLGVEDDGEVAVLGGDSLRFAPLLRREAEDRVPVLLVVPDPAVSGEEGVDDGQDLVGRGERGVGVTRAGGERLAPHQVARRQQLLGDCQPPQGLRARGGRREERVLHFLV